MLTKNTDELTREFFNSIMITPRYLDSDIPSLKTEIFGETFDTPVMTAALSHLHNICEDGMCEFAKGAKLSGALHFVGMGEDDELDRIIATGAKTVKIVKPHYDDEVIFRKLERAIKGGAFAVGMDIDHSVSHLGEYDNVMGFPMKTISSEKLASYIEFSKVPFIVKGVLSVEDAVKAYDAGAKGIILSHHHAIMDSMVPPLFILKEIKKAVPSDMKIFVDCGFESGMDVFKALALGADAVGIGRNLMGPLKDGAKGVADRIEAINRELKTVMARTGFKNVNEINDSVLRYRNF